MSAGATTRGGVAGAMPMLPLKRSKRIWIGAMVAMETIFSQRGRGSAVLTFRPVRRPATQRGAPGPSRPTESSEAAPAQEIP